MKNICIIANSPFTVLNFRKELIQKFISVGSTVNVLIPDTCSLVEVESTAKTFIQLGVNVIYIPLSRSSINPLKDLRLCFFLYKKLRYIAPDIVLNYTVKATIYGSIAAYLAKTPMIASNITGLGYAFTSRALKARVLSSLIKLQYRLALSTNRVVFFQNDDDRKLFESKKILKKGKSYLLAGSGVDTTFFSRVENKAQGTGLSFLFVGRLLNEKGICELVEVAKILDKEFENITITIVGGFDNGSSVISENDINKLSAQGVINYLGVISKQCTLKKIYSEHDVFVLPSYREGTPRSTLEALSMGLPVLTTDVPGCKDTVLEGINGKLVKSESVSDLYRGMKFFIENRDVLNYYGENSRKLAVEKFEVSIVNNNICSQVGL